MKSLDERIRAKAYEIAESEAFAGSPDEYWRQAECEIRSSVAAELSHNRSSMLERDSVAPILPVFPAVEAPSAGRMDASVPRSLRRDRGLFTFAGIKTVMSNARPWRMGRITVIGNIFRHCIPRHRLALSGDQRASPESWMRW